MSVLNNLQDWLSGGKIGDATDMLRNAGRNISAIETPDLASLIPQLQLQVQQGLMTPAQAQAALQQASEMAGVNSNAATLQGAMTGLNQLGDIADSGGLTQADQAVQTSLMNATNADRAQQLQAVLQRMQQQGLAGSGAELAARLSNQQGAANSNAETAAKIAQAAQARALEAMKAGVAGNTNLNQQMFDQAAAKAKAQDVVNAANAQARQAVALKNAEFIQNANKSNFDTANTIGAKNTDIRNENLKMPAQAAQANFTNQLNQQTASSKAQSDAAAAIMNQGNKEAQQSGSSLSGLASGVNEVVKDNGGWGNVASGIGSFVGGLFSSDENLKTDKHVLTDEDADKLLGELTGYRFRYKKDKNPQVGVMAQDMEKTPLKTAVVDTPAGKMINGDTTQAQVLALLANQNARIRKMEGK
jgi:hypothetical protein